MPLRLMEITLSEADEAAIQDLVEKEQIIGFWRTESAETGLLVKLLLTAEQTEQVLDQLEEKFADRTEYRVVMLPVEATLPRLEKQEAEPAGQVETETKPDVERLSREELYTDITDNAKFSNTYVAMVILSSIVATVGLLRGDVAIIIGAMVIAPLLGPNVALALATTLGDFSLGRQAIKTNLSGLGLALGLSIGAGYLLAVDPSGSQIASRTQVGFADVALALASGSAGVLAFTSGLSTAFIGVMVAVALLPPLVTLGLLLGAGYFPAALGTFLLLITNLICVNLAGVATFWVQGVRPHRWLEADKAKKSARLALALWSGLLLVLVLVIFLSQAKRL